MKNMIFVTVAAALLLVVVFQSEEPKQPQNKPAKTHSGLLAQAPTAKSLNDQINKHLHDLELKKNLNKMNAQIEWEDSYSELSATDSAEQEALPKHLDANVYDPASKVYEDLNPNEKGIRTVLPSERIQSKIANRRWVKEYDHEMRREYVYAFIDNMRRDGYEVRINENLEVVNVLKLRTPSSSVDQAIEKNFAFSR